MIFEQDQTTLIVKKIIKKMGTNDFQKKIIKMNTVKIIFKNSYILLFLAVIFIVSSCQEESLEFENSLEYKVENNIGKELRSGRTQKQAEDVDYVLTMISKVYARAQNDRELRSLVLSEAQRQQGGDNVVFYAGIRNQRLSGGTVAQLFAENAAALGYTTSADFFSTELVAMIPRLSFSVYTGIEGTDIREWSYNEPVTVVAETVAFGGDDEVSVTGFDGDLKAVKISNSEDPVNAVIVVENNSSFILINEELTRGDIENIITVTGVTGICDELLLLIHTLIVDLGDLEPSDPLYQTQLLSIQQFMTMYLELCDDTPPNEPTCFDGIQNGDEEGIDCGGTYCEDCDGEPPVNECNDDCERTPIDEREWITEIKVSHGELKKFCKWWKTYCNIQVDVVYGIPDGQSAVLETLPSKFINGKRKHMKKNKVFGANLPLYKWHWCEGEHSDIYAVNFIGKHHNAGTETTLNFGIPDFKIKLFGQEVGISGIFDASITFTAEDNPLGGDVIYYCDDIVDEDADDDGDDDGKKYTSGSIDFWITEQP